MSLRNFIERKKEKKKKKEEQKRRNQEQLILPYSSTSNSSSRFEVSGKLKKYDVANSRSTLFHLAPHLYVAHMYIYRTTFVEARSSRCNEKKRDPLGSLHARRVDETTQRGTFCGRLRRHRIIYVHIHIHMYTLPSGSNSGDSTATGWRTREGSRRSDRT